MLENDFSDSSSESMSSTYCDLPNFQRHESRDILNKLEIISGYVKHLEEKNSKNEDSLLSGATNRSWNYFLSDSKELYTELNTASAQCSTLQKKFECAKTLLDQDSQIKDKAARKNVYSQHNSFQAAVLLQPPCHLPTKINCTNNNKQQSVTKTSCIISNQSCNSTAFSVKTLGHYCRMFIDVTGKQKITTTASNLDEIHRNLQISVQETFKKIANLNYQLSCTKDDKERYKLQFQLNHLANEVELKKVQMAKLDRFIAEDHCKLNNDTITTNLSHGDEIKVITTIKSFQDHKPLSISHVTSKNQDNEKFYHSRNKINTTYQLKPSDLSWQ